MLILGSLPGRASLQAGQYYANPRNQFWHLVGAVMGWKDLATLTYDARVAALAAAGIGLWDVYTSAVRAGSLDAAIREAEAAPLHDLALSLPNLAAIAFNGKTAANAGRRLLTNGRWSLIDLPSSSPAHAALSLAEKRNHWLRLREHLMPD